MWDVGDVGCSGGGMFGMWDVREVGWWGCGMFGIWDVRDVGCSGCGMFGMWDVRHVGCSACGMFGMWDVRDVECFGCGMFGMWDVRCLPGCGMLIYKMPFWRWFARFLDPRSALCYNSSAKFRELVRSLFRTLALSLWNLNMIFWPTQ